MTRKIEEIVTLGYEEKKKGEEEEREEEEKKKRRKEKRRERKKKEKRKKRKRREKKKKEEVEIKELTEEEEEHGDDKLKSNKATEWGKLGWNWTEMRKNVEKKDEEENWRIGKEITGSEMEEKKRRAMKISNKKKGGKCQGILGKSSQWCNLDMKGKRRVRK